jgi:hypothetical protein
MDHDMPHVQGPEATRAILAADPDAVIIGYSNSWEGLDALHEAGCMWVCMGSDTEKLRALLRRVREGTIRDTDMPVCIDY